MKIINLCLIAVLLTSLTVKAQKYYALIYTTGDNWDHDKNPQDQPYFEEHSDHLAQLRKEGKISIGARYSDKGFILLNVKNENEAQEILKQDISVDKGIFKAELHPFNPFYFGEVKKNATTKITGLTLATYDHVAMVSFYTNVFNVKFESFQQEGFTLLQGSFSDIELLLCPAELARNKTNQNRHQLNIEVSEIEKTVELIKKNNGSIDGEIITNDKKKTIAFFDPDGNSMILTQQLEKD